jgi:hypothetical protein
LFPKREDPESWVYLFAHFEAEHVYPVLVSRGCPKLLEEENIAGMDVRLRVAV